MVACYAQSLKITISEVLDNLPILSIAKNVLKRIDEKLLARFDIQDYHMAATLLDPAIKNASWLKQFLRLEEHGNSTHEAKKVILKHYCELFKINTLDSVRNENSSPSQDEISSNPHYNARLRVLSALGN